MDKEQKITTEIKVPNKDLEVLRKHFSSCFAKNGNFDIKKFKQKLSKKKIDFYKESYGMDWLGKSYARLLASDSATTLLKEDEEFNQKEENKTSENLLIQGDNLEVLKHLSNAYYEKIKMIYIDPPYNTGSDDFVYQDDRTFSVHEFSNLTGVDEDKAKRILSFVDSKSNSHSAWLTFMYPRLYIAKQLLKDDGVIFVSIDDNEVAQLRLLMDEIFGEENFVGQFTIQTNPRGRQLDKFIAKTFEYIILYAKNIQEAKIFEIPKSDKTMLEYNMKDKKGLFRLLELRNRGSSQFNRNTRPNLYYPIYINPENNKISLEKNKNFTETAFPINSKNEDGCWTWGKNKVLNDINLLVSKKTKTGIFRVFRKDYIPANGATSKEKTLWLDKNINHENGKERVTQLVGGGIFDFPKSVSLIEKTIRIGAQNNDLILDFFAGSGTTGDAVMQLNAEDGGNRKYILVQLPESIDPNKNTTAYNFVKEELKVDEPTIFEITKERLIRSAKKIKEETIKTKIAEKQNEINNLASQLGIDDKEEKIKQLESDIKALKSQDLGFKIFETMPIWKDYNFEAVKLNQQTRLFDESKLSEDDLKVLLVTWKTNDEISLTQSLQEIDLDEYTGYYANEKLYLTNKGFKTENLKTLLEKIDFDKEFNPTSIIAFGYHFKSKYLQEIAGNIKSYANKKNVDIDFITRY